MNFKKVSILLVLVILMSSGFQCTTNPFAKKPVQLNPVKLSIWGVYENNEDLQILFDKYSQIHPTISFEYRKFRYDEYEQQLLEAWAEDRGPDIYFLPNNLIGKYQNKITPLPQKITLPYREIKSSGIGSFQKTDIIDYVKEISTLSLNALIEKFPQVVYEDVVKENQIYGLPLSLETMALFYNRAMLDNANIPEIPQTWTEFNNMVKNITLLDQNNNFVQSGVAMGTTNNISNASDIITLLIMQNGVPIVQENNQISFGQEEDLNLTIEAINFYNDFSNPIKEVYSWDKEQAEAIEAFKSGQSAFFFGFPHHLAEIKKTNLDFKISKMPQIDKNIGHVNVADYWVLAVSHKTAYVDPAWGFIDFAIHQENVKIYLEQTKKPTALRSLIEEQKQNPEIKPFAEQILTAQSWYRGNDPEKAENYILNMVRKIKEEILSLDNIKSLIQLTATQINQTIQ